ncbi:hypothetical protein AOLI_G00200330 [Acnodon oligacanthus]
MQQGEAPFLMFGRRPRLPTDLSFGVSPEEHNPKTHSTSVRDLKNRLKHAYRSASENVVKQPDENIPVCDVREENGDGMEQILHRALLLPCGFLPAKLNDDEELQTRHRPGIQASQPVAEVRSSEPAVGSRWRLNRQTFTMSHRH